MASAREYNYDELSEEELDDINKLDVKKIINYSPSLITYGDGTNFNSVYTVGIFPYSFDNFYGKYFSGTIICDENYAKSVFELDDISFLTQASEYNKAGVYITDYYADSLIYYNFFNSYDELIGRIRIDKYHENNTLYINGIINTNYKEKYSSFYNEFLTKSSLDTTNEKFLTFGRDMFHYYLMYYTFESDFISNLCHVENYNLLNGMSLNIYDGDSLLSKMSSDSDINNDKLTIITKSNFTFLKNIKEIKNDEIYFRLKNFNEYTKSNLSLDEWNNYLKDKTFKIEFKNQANNVFLVKELKIKLVDVNINVQDNIIYSAISDELMEVVSSTSAFIKGGAVNKK